MYMESDYYGDTNAARERDAREASEAREAELDARMEACSNGLVSYRAACEGGALYEAELMESIALGWVSAVSLKEAA